MFTPEDFDEFTHVQKVDSDSFLIVKKEELLEFNRHNFYIVKPNFEISQTYTDLKAVKQMLEKLCEVMGVKTYYKEHRMMLAIEVINPEGAKLIKSEADLEPEIEVKKPFKRKATLKPEIPN